MGLTIHYSLACEKTDTDAIRSVVAQMRALALELPFQAVEEIVEFGEDAPGNDGQEERHRWLRIQASQFVQDGDHYLNVAPLHVIAFSTDPGEGSEQANFGLARYPDLLQLRQSKKKKRQPTQLAGWSWKSFCKTQYASDPAHGGVANFVRCHLSIVELLQRIQKEKWATVEVHDESHYWDDRDVRKLGETVGEWNQMIAAVAGQIKDAGLGPIIQAPITQFANFEHLEAKGRDKRKKPRKR